MDSDYTKGRQILLRIEIGKTASEKVSDAAAKLRMRDRIAGTHSSLMQLTCADSSVRATRCIRPIMGQAKAFILVRVAFSKATIEVRLSLSLPQWELYASTSYQRKSSPPTGQTKPRIPTCHVR